MLISAYVLLGLVILIPSYGIGYLFNALSHRWWLALPVAAAGLACLAWAGRSGMSGMEWFALAAAGAGALLSSLTVLRFKRGDYKKFVEPTSGKGR